MGTPLILCCSMMRRAVPTVSSGGSVIGSVMMPFSLRLTLSTSRVWSAIEHVLVDDADAALLGQGDGQVALGDGVHRRRHDGDVEANVAGELGAARPRRGKSEPLIRLSSSCELAGIRSSGATEMAQSMPLSATSMPCCFRPFEDRPAPPARSRRMSKSFAQPDAFAHAGQVRVGAPAGVVAWPGRRRPAASDDRHAQGVLDRRPRLQLVVTHDRREDRQARRIGGGPVSGPSLFVFRSKTAACRACQPASVLRTL